MILCAQETRRVYMIYSVAKEICLRLHMVLPRKHVAFIEYTLTFLPAALLTNRINNDVTKPLIYTTNGMIAMESCK